MAKIRIFELAREVNLTSKELLARIDELSIPVKNHMSTLDEEQVQQVKALIRGTHEEKIVETRVKPTIIRRRRKIVRTETPAETVVEAESTETAAPETLENEAPPTPEEAPVLAQTPSAEAEAEPPAAKLKPKSKKRPAEPAAKIIRRPAAQEPETAQAPPAAEKESETAILTEAVEDAESQALPVEGTEAETAAPTEDAQAEAPEEPLPEVEALPPEEVKTAPIAKKPAPPKEPAAKIISRPKISIPPREPAAPGASRPEASGTEATAAGTAVGKARKKKKGRGTGDEETQDRKFFKKKIAFKRKEVIEGAALYSGGKRRKMRKTKRKGAEPQRPHLTEAKAIKRRIKIDDTINLAELAKRMGIKANEIILKLMSQGVMATVNQTLDFDTATLMAAEFNFEVERAAFEEETILRSEQTDDPEKMTLRPPVVTIMGHVDHGKTSLLDVIRESRVTDSEAGGITQHIGAYHVKTAKGRIVFLDTPGHEAFTAMRSRGARVTDLVILVVAADDGVMPQTIEAINHSKAAQVPIIVAINKMDKADANPDRVMRQLAEHGLNPEDWGGDTVFIPVSAKTHTGIDDLLEMVVLQSEMLELKANPDKLALGRVVEARLDAGRGAVATVLIQEGTLKHGDPVVCGVHYGKVRSLVNDQGQTVPSAGPSMPVEILGLSGVPEAGDELVALADEKDAKQVSQHRAEKQRSQDLTRANPVSLDNLFERMQEGELKELSVILKADVHGSIEALRDSL
ncbi:MAG: translation initiation factor IF-2, partial [Desulfobacterales bacterium]